MRLFKKAAAVAVASVMALSLAGCGGGSTATTAAATEAAKTEAAATEAAAEAATEAAAAAGDADLSSKKVGISIYKFCLLYTSGRKGGSNVAAAICNALLYQL